MTSHADPGAIRDSLQMAAGISGALLGILVALVGLHLLGLLA